MISCRAGCLPYEKRRSVKKPARQLSSIAAPQALEIQESQVRNSRVAIGAGCANLSTVDKTYTMPTRLSQVLFSPLPRPSLAFTLPYPRQPAGRDTRDSVEVLHAGAAARPAANSYKGCRTEQITFGRLPYREIRG